MRVILCLSLLCASLVSGPVRADGERSLFLDLARRGWVYQLRTAMFRRDPGHPPIRINGRDMAGAALCVVGEVPQPHTREVLKTFSDLMVDVFEKPVTMRFAGPDLARCGTGHVVYLRLYSGLAPNRAVTEDLRQMDRAYGIGLSPRTYVGVHSPAQAQTFFGRRGRATHLVVKQSATDSPTELERRFFTSILIEELFQSYTFGMDILHFDPKVAFVSKLEEMPVNLRHLAWDSRPFMEGLLRSNPAGLCRFDVFMLHALAASDVQNTNTDDFLDFIDGSFDDLAVRTDKTLTDADIAPILDADCGGAGD